MSVGGIATGYVATATSRQEPASQDVDLGKQQAPSADYVRVTGFAHTDLAIERKTKRFLETIVETYIPVTAAEWRRDQPVAYVLKVTEKQPSCRSLRRRRRHAPRTPGRR